ncbi:MAG TPA: cation-translocating P-type ATPase [Dehalococcoidales bacterium]|nr:cation-translocating P-type ATPase [Dehalococcoidales bacterium]
MFRFLKRYRQVLVSREFIIAAATALLILLSAILSLAGTPYWIHTSFAIAGVAVGGVTIAIGAIKGILKRQVNVDELVTIAIVASVIYGEYLAAAFVAFMMLFGKVLEDFTAERARTALEDLGKLVPVKATVRRNGQDITVPVADIVPGDIVIIKPGERLAVDGIVINGQASVNQAPITGESMPIAKSKGSEVFAGTLNELGALEINTTRVGSSTTLGQVMRLVEEAEENRAPIVRAADRFAKYVTPAILIIAAVVYFVSRDVSSALSVLIVACPCALVLATPIAIVAGVANGARRGILIKGGARLEAAGRVTAVALDKTGTITLGKPKVMKVFPVDSLSEESVLSLAAACERFSEHSLARAILARAKELDLEIPDSEDFKVVPGQGVSARVEESTILVGTEKLLKENNIQLSHKDTSMLKQIEDDGLTPVLVAKSEKVVGIIGFADTIREEMRQAIQSLKNSGVKKVVMLTGDSPEVARRVAESVGIDEWKAQLLPQKKVEAIQEMQRAGYKVAMIGDGINDAPALAQADVGIAMGATGTDIAMEASNVILLKDDILSAAESIHLSRSTLKTIKQNLVFALIFNVLGIALASVAILNPIASALFHNVGSVAVVVNSARLVGARALHTKKVRA